MCHTSSSKRPNTNYCTVENTRGCVPWNWVENARLSRAEWNEWINLKSKQNSTKNSINHKAMLWAMWITHLANTWSNHTTMTVIPILVCEHTAPGAVKFLLLVSHNYNCEIVSFFPSPPISHPKSWGNLVLTQNLSLDSISPWENTLFVSDLYVSKLI